ncbi:MAG TPA: glycoside hydrolase family 43 protein [Steroidobacteraceae bacterium]
MRTLLIAAILSLAAIAARAGEASFEWFEYTGRDATNEAPLPAGSYRNPVLAGYYPDPAVERVGDKFYLVNSSFAHWPGIPIHESTDLVNWKLVGHALSDPGQVSFDGLGISRGVFAPSIHHHDGTFYVVNTLVDAGGNFYVTAKNPAGPWSKPVWLKEIDGIDPSFFFDRDGKAYILNNGPPDGPPKYNGHRAIWIQEFDVAAGKPVGPRKVLVDGGVDIARRPIWIEGPHLYRINGWYYLMCAEGGTGPDHSEVIFRSRSPWGPFEPGKHNPILTQRDLPAGRANAVTNAGHADLVQMKDGSWWAIFLASRPYRGNLYNTGRETFLLPVEWMDGWPVILDQGKPIPYAVPGPRNLARGGKGDALSGNFTRREEFVNAPGPEWIQVRVPSRSWYQVRDGALKIEPLGVRLDALANPSFLARRQQHMNFDASTEVAVPDAGASAGIAVFQNERHWYFFGVRRTATGVQAFVERQSGKRLRAEIEDLAASPASLKLRVSANGNDHSFLYDAGQGWQPLLEHDDGSFLSTEIAGGFVGTVLGPYARQD